MEPLKSVTLGAMGSLLRKLDELARTEDAARQLQDDLDIISTNLSKLSMAEEPSITANYWMKDVRELSYDMEDCVDQFFLADDSDAKMAWINNLLGFRSRLDEVRERYDRYNLEYGLSHPTTTVRRRFQTMYRELHVGMAAPINRLRQLIEPKSNDENDLQLKVISILGVEGVGKSMLAQNMWRDFEGQFEYRAFVQTAKMPDMKIILHSILSQICLQQTPEACSVPNLIHDIRKHLQDKRFVFGAVHCLLLS